MSTIELDLIRHETCDHHPYHHLHIHLMRTEIRLDDLKGLSVPPLLEADLGIVLEGRAPLWLYGYLSQYCQHLPWIACYEPRLLGAVVAVDRTNSGLLGQVLPLELPAEVFRKTQPEPVADLDAEVVVMNAQLQLQVTELTTEQGSSQAIAIAFANRVDPDAPVSVIKGKKTLSNLMPPQALATLALPDGLNLDQEVILFGAGPPWLFVHLLERCRQAPWVGFYDLRMQGVVVIASRIAKLPTGGAVPVIFNRAPGLAIFIGGPPDSGKSVLSNALRRSLTHHCPHLKLYLHRANWDGESNASYEMPPILAKQLANENEIKLDRQENAAQIIREYFQYHADAIANIRNVMDIVLVDVGGLPQLEKAPVVEQCTHYIVISSKPDKIQEWHNLCADKLEPVFIIHSKLAPCLTVLGQHPYLEVEAGPWLRGETQEVPQLLLEQVLCLL